MLNLKNLTKTRRDEISRMESAIRGNANAVLWTTAMRASTRGGKCSQIEADEIARD